MSSTSTSAAADPRRRSDVTPRRDRRFKDAFNTSAKIDGYYRDTSRPVDERAFALVYKRLREMDVPEWMVRSSHRRKIGHGTTTPISRVSSGTRRATR